MTDAINQARGLISGLDWHSETAVPGILEGVCLAVLALAEQQQVANRIALAQYELAVWGRPRIHEGFGVLAYPEAAHEDYRLEPSIAAALT